MQDAGGTTTYAYSDRSELVGKTLPGGYRLTMAYDAVGNRTTLIDPDGGVFSYTYSARNETALVIGPTGARTTFQYDAAGQRTTLADASGATRKYQYDNAGRLTTQIEVNASSNPIITIVDTYDPVGNRTRRDQAGAMTAIMTWVYDDAYRLLTQQKPSGWATFTYDNAGNILVKAQQHWYFPLTMAYDAANRLTTLLQPNGTFTSTYDANGNLVKQESGAVVTTYTYDNENRLTGILVQNAVRSTYTYDGDGLRRSAFEAGGVLTTFIWDGTDYLMEKQNDVGGMWDAAQDFSLSSNPNGNWTYGSTPTLGGTFRAHTLSSSAFLSVTDLSAWYTPGTSFNTPFVAKNATSPTSLIYSGPVILPPDALQLTPGDPTAGHEYSVVRFTAPSNGTYSFVGRFESDDASLAGASCDVVVQKNGTTIFSGSVVGYGAPSAQYFSLTETLAANDTIDFAAGIQGVFGNDNVILSVKVVKA